MSTLKKPIKELAKGFTLVETMVAIAIIMVALVGPFEAVEHSLTASYIARDELIGNSLAQEGVEYVRGVRDGNYLYDRANPLPATQHNFTYGLHADAPGIPNCVDYTCTVDPLAPVGVAPVQVCLNNVCPALYISPQPLYQYNQQSSGSMSRFTRSIQLCYMNGSSCTAAFSNEARLTVTVTWTTEQQPHTTTITEYLQSWL